MWQIVVSDNSSTDDTTEMVDEIGRRFPSVRYVRNEENVGILRNVDIAVRSCLAEYVWIVADDDVIMPFAVETVVRAVKGAGQRSRPASFIFLNAFSVAPDDTWLRASGTPTELAPGLVEQASEIFLAFPYEAVGHITRLVVRRAEWSSSPFIVAGPYEVWGVIRHLLTVSRMSPAYFVESPLVGGRKKHGQAHYDNHVALAYCIELPSYDARLIIGREFRGATWCAFSDSGGGEAFLGTYQDQCIRGLRAILADRRRGSSPYH